MDLNASTVREHMTGASCPPKVLADTLLRATVSSPESRVFTLVRNRRGPPCFTSTVTSCYLRRSHHQRLTIKAPRRPARCRRAGLLDMQRRLEAARAPTPS